MDINDIQIKILNLVKNDFEWFDDNLKNIFKKNIIYVDETRIKETKLKYSKREIRDLLDLKIYNDQKIVDNYKIIIDYVVDALKNQLPNYDIEQIKYGIFSLYYLEIQKNLKEKWENCQPKYEIKHEKLNVKNYFAISTGNDFKYENIKDKYLFWPANEIWTQYLDSQPEEWFGERIIENVVEEYWEDIILFFKNPKNSNIGTFEFADENGQIHIEHVDYILRIKNRKNKIKTVYIEVKAGSKYNESISLLDNVNSLDYDENKTNLIRTAFKFISKEIDDHTFISINKIDQIPTKIGNYKYKYGESYINYKSEEKEKEEIIDISFFKVLKKLLNLNN